MVLEQFFQQIRTIFSGGPPSRIFNIDIPRNQIFTNITTSEKDFVSILKSFKGFEKSTDLITARIKKKRDAQFAQINPIVSGLEKQVTAFEFAIPFRGLTFEQARLKLFPFPIAPPKPFPVRRPIVFIKGAAGIGRGERKSRALADRIFLAAERSRPIRIEAMRLRKTLNTLRLAFEGVRLLPKIRQNLFSARELQDSV